MNPEYYKQHSRIPTCTNCGKLGHYNKTCREPPTSYGIILIKMCNVALSNENIQPVEDHTIVNDCIEQHGEIDMNGLMSIASKDKFESIGKHLDSIRFLMVSRKHSLGYCEFIRGRYRIESVEGIQFLFKQMMPHEIQDIGEKNFDELWNEFWGNDDRKTVVRPNRRIHIDFESQYLESKDKFDKLRKKDGKHLSLDFYTRNVMAEYLVPEWGFPKGRKKVGELDIDCAIREFSEETGLSKSDFVIIDNIEPIVENMVGTDGKKYRHIYYIAEMITEKNPTVGDTLPSSEIGGVHFFTYDEAMEAIRDYHKEKKEILTGVFVQYMNKLMNPEENTLLEKPAIEPVKEVTPPVLYSGNATDDYVYPEKKDIVYEWVLDDDDLLSPADAI